MAPSSCTLCLTDITTKEQEIKDNILFVNDDMVHETCLQCKDCGMHLKETCFKDKDDFFCHEHFYNRSCSPKCGNCNKAIAFNQLAVPLADKRYHSDCVICSVCNLTIQKGQKISLVDGKIVCEMDLKKKLTTSVTNVADDESVKTTKIPQKEVV